MFKRLTVWLALCLCCWAFLVGCGGDSNTNGSLALTTPTVNDLSAGLFSVDVTATYSNVTHAGALQGFPIWITMSAHNRSGTVIGVPVTTKHSANSAGIVTDHLQVSQTNEVIFVDVTAYSGNLSDSKTVAVPSNAAMTATV